jgi:uncharacterized protein YndB with AHSA1/START domain
MTGEHAGGRTRTSRIIKARPEDLYEAFIDPDALVAWLPPAEMTGAIHEFDARVGGGYRMSLFYPPNERSFRGKTSDREDIVNVRFVELAPPHRMVAAGNFETTRSGLPRRDDDRGDVRRGVRRNRSHHRVHEPPGRLTRGGQRSRLAIITGTACSPVRMTRSEGLDNEMT